MDAKNAMEWLNQRWYLYIIFAFIVIFTIVVIVLSVVVSRGGEDGDEQAAQKEEEQEEEKSVDEPMSTQSTIYDKLPGQPMTMSDKSIYGKLPNLENDYEVGNVPEEKVYVQLPSKIAPEYDVVQPQSEYGENPYSKSPLPFK